MSNQAEASSGPCNNGKAPFQHEVPDDLKGIPLGFIGTGGTIASRGKHAFDYLDYQSTNDRLKAQYVLEYTGLKNFIKDKNTDILDVGPLDSTAITYKNWLDIAEKCYQLQRQSVRGIVIGHGTATLEETSWFLFLTLKLNVPVVVTGPVVPLTGASSDATRNLVDSFRVAARPIKHDTGPGVVVVMNSQVHTPREVVKAHTIFLDAFDFGHVGSVCGEHVNITVPRSLSYSNPPKISELGNLFENLPRVDITYSYIDADGAAVTAFYEAGARGIVSAGFHPGLSTGPHDEALTNFIKPRKGEEDKKQQRFVVQSTRAGNGPVYKTEDHEKRDFIGGYDYTPQKARILLQICLARELPHNRIQEIFDDKEPQNKLWV